jgi:hypothetical protein
MQSLMAFARCQWGPQGGCQTGDVRAQVLTKVTMRVVVVPIAIALLSLWESEDSLRIRRHTWIPVKATGVSTQPLMEHSDLWETCMSALGAPQTSLRAWHLSSSCERMPDKMLLYAVCKGEGHGQ